MGERVNLRRDSVHPRKGFKDDQTTAKGLGVTEDDQGDGRGKERRKRSRQTSVGSSRGDNG